jgi:hypothetical protein
VRKLQIHRCLSHAAMCCAVLPCGWEATRDPRRLATPNGLITQIKREVRVWGNSKEEAKGESGAGNSPGVARWRSCGGGWRLVAVVGSAAWAFGTVALSRPKRHRPRTRITDSGETTPRAGLLAEVAASWAPGRGGGELCSCGGGGGELGETSGSSPRSQN